LVVLRGALHCRELQRKSRKYGSERISLPEDYMCVGNVLFSSLAINISKV
jgi:hypothetical protein